ncbi:hypothetical protein [Chitinivorax sp. B]|uniref:hypothetical protein n=1 Tax=Chitinivorax sp. B TaxID=2502235 RepID=UPI0010F7EF1C|nr:hypothetical protein [Chitinivorax sp. B]
MTGIWVLLATRQAVTDIQARLKQWFPDLQVEAWSHQLTLALEQDPTLNQQLILFDVEYDSGPFQTSVILHSFPGPQENTLVMLVMIELARRFSDAFTCRAMCDGHGYGDNSSPYWNLIWEQGYVYLADVSATFFTQCGDDAIEIVRQLDLSRHHLDHAGRLSHAGDQPIRTERIDSDRS